MMPELQERPLADPPSAPRYTTLVPVAQASRHLLVAEARVLPAIEDFLAQLAATPAGASALCLGRASTLHVSATFCTDATALERELQQELAASETGLRLYIAGDEAFVWRVQRTARAAGLLRDEIVAQRIGTARTVFCVHCSGSHDYEAHDEVTCVACGIRLGVRTHFSERLGAWLGVCADVDRPYAETRA